MDMANVFVSHAHQDASFVSLLVKLLRMREINAWYSAEIRPGRPFRAQIAEALEVATDIVVVVSADSAKSKWVTSEVSSFQMANSSRRIIPILLDDTPPNSVWDGLAEFQSIDFSDSSTGGIDQLLAVFGTVLLPRTETEAERRNRRAGDRRKSGARAASSDRRKTPLIQRMRRGFWNQFHSHTGMGKQEPMETSARAVNRIIDQLIEEGEKYSYVGKLNGVLHSPDQALWSAATRVWETLRDKNPVSAVNVVEMIAEELAAQFDISPRSRRSAQRRSFIPVATV